MTFARTLLALVLLAAFLVPAANAVPGPSKTTIMPRTDAVFSGYPGPVVDPVLERELTGAGDADELEVVVQFHHGVTRVDLATLDRLGLEVLHRYQVLPAVWARGSPSSVRQLSYYEGVFWMEYNERLKFMMDRSLSTINATRAWASPVYDSSGTMLEEGIDGSGVTVVVLDSGIDAGHPDLDYGEKTIMNLKSDTGTGPWYEIENGDTSMGHGTHCAGTVAGNGDASGGARRGVAPGANLIGLSAGDALYITGAVGGMEWVYQNSRPNENPHNIRAVSNSWGSGGGEYQPQDSINQITERITYENNVMVVFAAGNSGGDGSDIQSSNYGNTPVALCVAALERDGSGVAEFSSRGQSDLNQTFPDIGAPGVKIWSTAARRTWISAMTKQSNPSGIDPYYFAISGTSMATPHVAGLTALLWQANPDLHVSDVHEHYQPGGQYVDDGWFSNPTTRVHDIELILELSASYIPSNGENGVPDSTNYTGHFDRPYDFAQGYGCVQADRAVGLALTLKELRTRDFDGDGRPDYPDATAYDAFEQYAGTMKREMVSAETDTLYTEWRGEWSRFNNQTAQMIPFQHDQSHLVYVPQEAATMELDLQYEAVSISERSVTSLNLIIDYDMDGSPDWSQPSGGTEGRVHSELDLTGSGFAENRGNLWGFNVEGQGFQLPFQELRKGDQFVEVRVEYAASVSLHFPLDNGTVTVDTGHMAPYVGQLSFGDPSPGYTGGGIVKATYVYDMGEVEEPGKKKSAGGVEPIEPWLAVLALIALMAVVYVAWYRRKHGEFPSPARAFSK